MKHAMIFLMTLSCAAQDSTIHIDAAVKMGPYKPIYGYFGYDEPNFTYAANGRKLIGELASGKYAVGDRLCRNPP